LQLAAISSMAAFLPACRESVPARLEQGDRFPDITLPYLDGRNALFMAGADVTSVVSFWASWCEPCRREMPGLEKLSQIFHPDDLLVIGISVDSDVNLAREFCLKYGLTITMLSDGDMALSNGVLRITGFPTSYLLKRDRTIARVIVGERDWMGTNMVGEIEGLLAVRRAS
jgi:peroxiredoxin